jgi:DNA primase
MRVDLANLKLRHPLPAALERDGIKLRRCTDHFVCLCPFHREKTPSCHVWLDHLHCWGCNAHEDIIGYLRKTRSLTFPEALRVLGGHEPFVYHHSTARFIKEAPPKTAPRDFSQVAMAWSAGTTEAQMTDLAAKLGTSCEALYWLGCGWAPEHKAWAFPMHDATQRVIGVRLRDERGRKWAVKESKNGLFIPTIAPDRRLIICEGPTDTAAALSIGFYAIGRASCNSGVDLVLGFLKKNRIIREVVLISDNDSPGLKGAAALREQLPVKSWLLMLPMKDIRRYCQLGGERSVIETMVNAQTPMLGKK